MRPRPRVLIAGFGIVVATACSDGSGPTTPPHGTFSARLGGSPFASLTGTATAGPIFTEESPDGLFVIRMIGQTGSVIRLLIVSCPGTVPPAPGSHDIGPNPNCTARYVRLAANANNEAVVTESADATSGRFTIAAVTADEVDGTFDFQGELIVGSEAQGSFSAEGSFRAVR